MLRPDLSVFKKRIYESTACAKTTPAPPKGRGTQTEHTAGTLAAIVSPKYKPLKSTQ